MNMPDLPFAIEVAKREHASGYIRDWYISDFGDIYAESPDGGWYVFYAPNEEHYYEGSNDTLSDC